MSAGKSVAVNIQNGQVHITEFRNNSVLLTTITPTAISALWVSEHELLEIRDAIEEYIQTSTEDYLLGEK